MNGLIFGFILVQTGVVFTLAAIMAVTIGKGLMSKAEKAPAAVSRVSRLSRLR